MNPITPTASNQQFQISHQVAQTVPTFPTVIADLIGQYADENSDADQPLAFDVNQEIIDNDQNRNIRAAIKRVLTSDGDPARKVLVFKNVQSVFDQPSESDYPAYYARIAHIRYNEAINTLLNEIRSEGGQINLDFTVFSDFHFSNFVLSGASVKGARFINTSMTDMNWQGADFSATRFEGGICQYCDFTGANMTRSVWDKTYHRNSTITRADFRLAEFHRAEFSLVFADGLISDDAELMTLIASNIVTDVKAGNL